jgi:hypothetical protein
MTDTRDHAGARADAAYCHRCGDRNGALLPYETVLAKSRQSTKLLQSLSMPSPQVALVLSSAAAGAVEHARAAAPDAGAVAVGAVDVAVAVVVDAVVARGGGVLIAGAHAAPRRRRAGPCRGIACVTGAPASRHTVARVPAGLLRVQSKSMQST